MNFLHGVEEIPLMELIAMRRIHILREHAMTPIFTIPVGMFDKFPSANRLLKSHPENCVSIPVRSNRTYKACRFPRDIFAPTKQQLWVGPDRVPEFNAIVAYNPSLSLASQINPNGEGGLHVFSPNIRIASDTIETRYKCTCKDIPTYFIEANAEHIDIKLSVIDNHILYTKEFEQRHPRSVGVLKSIPGYQTHRITHSYDCEHNAVNVPVFSNGKVIVDADSRQVRPLLEDIIGAERVIPLEFYPGETGYDYGLRCRTNEIALIQNDSQNLDMSEQQQDVA